MKYDRSIINKFIKSSVKWFRHDCCDVDKYSTKEYRMIRSHIRSTHTQRGYTDLVKKDRTGAMRIYDLQFLDIILSVFDTEIIKKNTLNNFKSFNDDFKEDDSGSYYSSRILKEILPFLDILNDISNRVKITCYEDLPLVISTADEPRTGFAILICPTVGWGD